MLCGLDGGGSATGQHARQRDVCERCRRLSSGWPIVHVRGWLAVRVGARRPRSRSPATRRLVGSVGVRFSSQVPHILCGLTLLGGFNVVSVRRCACHGAAPPDHQNSEDQVQTRESNMRGGAYHRLFCTLRLQPASSNGRRHHAQHHQPRARRAAGAQHGTRRCLNREAADRCPSDA